MMVNFLANCFLQPVYAQDSPLELLDVAARGLNILILISSAIFVGFVVFAAYKFASSEGDPKGIQGAKQSLTYAVIGLLVVVGVFVINAVVINILNPTNPTALSDLGNLFRSIRITLCEIEIYAGIDDPGCGMSAGGPAPLPPAPGPAPAPPWGPAPLPPAPGPAPAPPWGPAPAP